MAIRREMMHTCITEYSKMNYEYRRQNIRHVTENYITITRLSGQNNKQWTTAETN